MRRGALSKQRTEPIAADAREGKDGKKAAKLKLLAGLLGVKFEALARRDQRRRRQNWLLGVALCGVLLATVFGIWYTGETARRAEVEARQVSELDTALERATALMRDDLYSDAIALLEDALGRVTISSSAVPREFRIAANRARFSSRLLAVSEPFPEILYDWRHQAPYLLGNGGSDLSIIDDDSLATVLKVEHEGPWLYSYRTRLLDETTIAIAQNSGARGTGIRHVPIQGGDERWYAMAADWTWLDGFGHSTLPVFPGRRGHPMGAPNAVGLFDAKGQLLTDFSWLLEEEVAFDTLKAMPISSDAMLINDRGRWLRADGEASKLKQLPLPDIDPASLSVHADGHYLAACDTRGRGLLIDLESLEIILEIESPVSLNNCYVSWVNQRLLNTHAGFVDLQGDARLAIPPGSVFRTSSDGATSVARRSIRVAKNRTVSWHDDDRFRLWRAPAVQKSITVPPPQGAEYWHIAGALESGGFYFAEDYESLRFALPSEGEWRMLSTSVDLDQTWQSAGLTLIENPHWLVVRRGVSDGFNWVKQRFHVFAKTGEFVASAEATEWTGSADQSTWAAISNQESATLRVLQLNGEIALESWPLPEEHSQDGALHTAISQTGQLVAVHSANALTIQNSEDGALQFSLIYSDGQTLVEPSIAFYGQQLLVRSYGSSGETLQQWQPRQTTLLPLPDSANIPIGLYRLPSGEAVEGREGFNRKSSSARVFSAGLRQSETLYDDFLVVPDVGIFNLQPEGVDFRATGSLLTIDKTLRCSAGSIGRVRHLTYLQERHALAFQQSQDLCVVDIETGATVFSQSSGAGWLALQADDDSLQLLLIDGRVVKVSLPDPA